MTGTRNGIIPVSIRASNLSHAILFYPSKFLRYGDNILTILRYSFRPRPEQIDSKRFKIVKRIIVTIIEFAWRKSKANYLEIRGIIVPAKFS